MGKPIQDALADRFSDAPQTHGLEYPGWRSLAARASCRRFSTDPVSSEMIDTLCALALASPSKSDLQQRDLVIVDDTVIRQSISDKIPGGQWIARAPVFIIFCGNNRRHRQVMQWRGMPFTNDHLDAFFNAAVDAGIALSAFVTAAEAAGLGCCPISVIRNEAKLVGELVGLPDYVFPVAGLTVGWPAGETEISKRLPLTATVHRNRFEEGNVRELIEAYDAWRAASQPYEVQRDVARFGATECYGWSEDKARQYAGPEREDFGAYIRSQGFVLD